MVGLVLEALNSAPAPCETRSSSGTRTASSRWPARSRSSASRRSCSTRASARSAPGAAQQKLANSSRSACPGARQSARQGCWPRPIYYRRRCGGPGLPRRRWAAPRSMMGKNAVAAAIAEHLRSAGPERSGAERPGQHRRRCPPTSSRDKLRDRRSSGSRTRSRCAGRHWDILQILETRAGLRVPLSDFHPDPRTWSRSRKGALSSVTSTTGRAEEHEHESPARSAQGSPSTRHHASCAAKSALPPISTPARRSRSD